MELAGKLEAIAARLDEVGDPVAAERLRGAQLGSTSGEILAAAGAELDRLARAGYGRDPAIGPLLRATRDELDVVNHNPRAVGRRVRHLLRRRFGRSDPG